MNYINEFVVNMNDDNLNDVEISATNYPALSSVAKMIGKNHEAFIIELGEIKTEKDKNDHQIKDQEVDNGSHSPKPPCSKSITHSGKDNTNEKETKENSPLYDRVKRRKVSQKKTKTETRQKRPRSSSGMIQNSINRNLKGN